MATSEGYTVGQNMEFPGEWHPGAYDGYFGFCWVL